MEITGCGIKSVWFLGWLSPVLEAWGQLGPESVWQVPELDLLSDPLPSQKNNQPTNQRPLPPPTPARNSFSSPASLRPWHPLLTGSQNSLGLTGSVYVSISTAMKVNHPVPFRSPESQPPTTRDRAGEPLETQKSFGCPFSNQTVCCSHLGLL